MVPFSRQRTSVGRMARAQKSSLMGEKPQYSGEHALVQSTESGQALRQRCEYSSLTVHWSFWLTGVPFSCCSVLSTTAHVQEFYKDSHKHIKAGDNNAGWLFQELLGECVGVVSLQRWRNQRQHFDASFTRTAANGYTNVLISQARHYVQELKLREDETINPANDLKHAPFLMVATVLFGPLSQVQSQELLELAPLREDLFRVCFKGGVNRIRLGRYLPWSASSSLRKFQKRWTTFVDRSYQQAKQQGFEGPVVHVWESAKEGSISFKEVGGHV
jgi:gliotoxin/aspirochlorine/mycotoxins biosynthesis cytochrome P450 monooxygenase